MNGGVTPVYILQYVEVVQFEVSTLGPWATQTQYSTLVSLVQVTVALLSPATTLTSGGASAELPPPHPATMATTSSIARARSFLISYSRKGGSGGDAGIRTLDTGFSPYAPLAGECLRPLGHVSGVAVPALRHPASLPRGNLPPQLRPTGAALGPANARFYRASSSPVHRACGQRLGTGSGSRSLAALVQLERLVQHAHGELEVLLVDHDRDLDLGGRDHLDVDALAGQRLEHLGREPDVRAHADADDGHLGDPVVTDDFACLERLAALRLEHAHRLLVLVAIDREREIGVTRRADVLHDHVDVDVGRGDRAEDRVGDAGPVLDAHHRDLGFVAVERDPRDD